MKLNHHRRNNNLSSLLLPTVQNEISRIETNEAKHCHQIYKRTRIFVTPRVVEFSMKSNLLNSKPTTHHTHAEDRNRRTDQEDYRNAMNARKSTI